jgi:hypothetical protein
MSNNPESDSSGPTEQFQEILEHGGIIDLADDPFPEHLDRITSFYDQMATAFCDKDFPTSDDLRDTVQKMSLSFGNCVQQVLEDGYIFDESVEESESAAKGLFGLLLGELAERKKLFANLTGCEDFLGSEPFKLSTENLNDPELIGLLTKRFLTRLLKKEPEEAAAKLFDNYTADLLTDMRHLYSHIEELNGANMPTFTVTLVRKLGKFSFDLDPPARQKTSRATSSEEILYADYAFTVEPPVKFFDTKALEQAQVTMVARDKKRLYGQVRTPVSWQENGHLDEILTQNTAASILKPFFAQLNQLTFFVAQDPENS